MKKILLLIALLIPVIGFAEVTPLKGEFDPRVRVVEYNRQNVVKINTFYGVSTHVEFSEKETITDIAAGDDTAWEIVKRSGNHLFIKPKATHADTNLTVVTDKRVYNFALTVVQQNIKNPKAWKAPDLIYSLSFSYPDEEASKKQLADKKDAIHKILGEMKSKLASDKDEPNKDGEKNFDYWVSGDVEVSPTNAEDNGRFIRLTFSNNRDIPAFYETDSDGKESLINSHIEDGNTVVIERMVRKLTLRKGVKTACVVNKSFDIEGGIDNKSGTVSPSVQRVIKGAE